MTTRTHHHHRLLAIVALCLSGSILLAQTTGPDTVNDDINEDNNDTTATAIFAGGCFWCMEPPFDKLDGVVATTSGYIGGDTEDPSYEEVSAGNTGHTEAVEVRYDPSRISYSQLLEVFWHNIDPLDSGGQFCDRGSQYRSAIFYLNDEQQRIARQSVLALDMNGILPGRIKTQIEPADTFYAAEEYHQDYYEKNPIRYRFYRFSCGRDGRLEELWDS